MPGRTALILYGTETGTAQDLALELSRALTRLHFTTDVVGLDDIPHATHFHNYALTAFVVATTGQGDFPNNARLFWKSLLRRKLGAETLRGVRYALVGLGDTSYLKFNWAARKLDKRLKQLGAAEVVEACEADEQGDEGIEGFFLEWLKGFRDRALELWPLSNGTEVIPEDVPIPDRWRLCLAHEHLNGSLSNGDHESRDSPSPQMSGSFPAVLEVNDRATPSDHWQDVRLMKLRSPSRHEYLPGDALAIMPENDPNDVTTIISHMSWQDHADMPLTLQSTVPSNTTLFQPSLAKPPLSLQEGQSITLRALLTTHLDISAIPRRSFFATIAKYTDDDMHKARLLEFTEPQYLDEYFDYATRPRRGIIEVLQEFNSVKIPWQEAINVFPLLRPRQFSIASACNASPSLPSSGAPTTSEETVFDLLIAIVKYRTVIKRIRQGVCTRYLARLPTGTKLQVALRSEGRIATLQDLLTRNHVLIGAGTGIAPLRSLVLAKQAIAESTESAVAKVGSTTLIFGARNERADFFFADDWAALSRPTLRHASGDGRGVLDFRLVTAFSRDQDRKIYVQDRIREQAALLAPLMRDANTTVVVCGASGSMPKAVRQAMVDVLGGGGRAGIQNRGEQEEEGLSEEAGEAERFVEQMEKEGRYKQETWS
jgi:sulfite reductase alpha subunit-like flavoprotein